MGDYLTEALNMATGGQWADASLVTESDKSKAKALLKRYSKDKTDEGRGARSYLRAVASGRDADYLLDQKGSEGDGARAAKKAIKEGFVEAEDDRVESIVVEGVIDKAYKAMSNEQLLKAAADIYFRWGEHYKKSKKNAELSLYAIRSELDRRSLMRKAQQLIKSKQGKQEDDSVIDPADALHEMEAGELDSWWQETRGKLVRGSKPTRKGRLNGCYDKLTTRMARTGGIKVSGQSHTDKNPVPKRERDVEDQPKDGSPGELPDGVSEAAPTAPPHLAEKGRQRDEIKAIGKRTVGSQFWSEGAGSDKFHVGYKDNRDADHYNAMLKKLAVAYKKAGYKTRMDAGTGARKALYVYHDKKKIAAAKKQAHEQAHEGVRFGAPFRDPLRSLALDGTLAEEGKINWKRHAQALLKQAGDEPIGYKAYLRAIIQGNREQATHLRSAKSYMADAARAMQALIDSAGKGEPMGEARLRESKKGMGRIWEFNKPASAKKFYDMIMAVQSREKDADWYPELSRKNPNKVAVTAQSKLDRSVMIKLDNLAVAHHGRRIDSVFEGYEGSKKYKGKRLSPADDEEGEFDTASGGTSPGPIKKVKAEQNNRLSDAVARFRAG